MPKGRQFYFETNADFWRYLYISDIYSKFSDMVSSCFHSYRFIDFAFP